MANNFRQSDESERKEGPGFVITEQTLHYRASSFSLQHASNILVGTNASLGDKLVGFVVHILHDSCFSIKDRNDNCFYSCWRP